MQVFLSYHFGDEDAWLKTAVDSLLSSHDIRPVTGRRLGGGQLTQQIREKIDRSHALIALLTERQDGHAIDWVQDELNYARGHGKEAIALIEPNVPQGGMFAEHEHIPLDRNRPLPAFLALSETLRIWKDEIGRRRIAHILPPAIGQVIRTTPGMRCRYRFVTDDGSRGSWVEADPVPQPGGGALLHLTGIRDDSDTVEVELRHGDTMTWWSEATPQFISVELKARDGQ